MFDLWRFVLHVLCHVLAVLCYPVKMNLVNSAGAYHNRYIHAQMLKRRTFGCVAWRWIGPSFSDQPNHV